MIVLLPLRGWVGDAMAMEMEMMAPATAQAEPASDMHTDMAMMDDCPGHAAAHDGAQAKTVDCNTCTVCQICHAVALTPSVPYLAPAPLPASRPPAVAPHFASAERAPGFKPPIS